MACNSPALVLQCLSTSRLSLAIRSVLSIYFRKRLVQHDHYDQSKPHCNHFGKSNVVYARDNRIKSHSGAQLSPATFPIPNKAHNTKSKHTHQHVGTAFLPTAKKLKMLIISCARSRTSSLLSSSLSLASTQAIDPALCCPTVGTIPPECIGRRDICATLLPRRWIEGFFQKREDAVETVEAAAKE